jgi:hypothetical protein
MRCSGNAAENSDFKETNDVLSALDSTLLSEARVHTDLTSALHISNVIFLENSFDFCVFSSASNIYQLILK